MLGEIGETCVVGELDVEKVLERTRHGSDVGKAKKKVRIALERDGWRDGEM